MKFRGTIVIDWERCKGCKLCAEACAKGVIEVSGRRVNVHGYPYAEAVNLDACIGCAMCAVVCPDACITVYKKKEED